LAAVGDMIARIKVENGLCNLHRAPFWGGLSSERYGLI